MDSREIVKRAIEFGRPPRLPFWQSLFPGIPDDVRDCWEMDRQKASLAWAATSASRMR